METAGTDCEYEAYDDDMETFERDALALDDEGGEGEDAINDAD